MEEVNEKSELSPIDMHNMQTNGTSFGNYYYTNGLTLEKSFPTCAYKFVTIIRRQTVEIANKK